jgi:tRNA 2-thiouridine synthesizing protein A
MQWLSRKYMPVDNEEYGKERSMSLVADEVLDCSGLSCPLPIVKVSRKIKEISMGQILKMIATDSGAPADMEAWSRQTGHELMASLQEQGKYIFFIKRTK